MATSRVRHGGSTIIQQLAKNLGPWLAGSGVESVVDTNLLGTDGDPAIGSTFRARRTDEGIILLERRHE